MRWIWRSTVLAVAVIGVCLLWTLGVIRWPSRTPRTAALR